MLKQNKNFLIYANEWKYIGDEQNKNRKKIENDDCLKRVRYLRLQELYGLGEKKTEIEFLHKTICCLVIIRQKMTTANRSKSKNYSRAEKTCKRVPTLHSTHTNYKFRKYATKFQRKKINKTFVVEIRFINSHFELKLQQKTLLMQKTTLKQSPLIYWFSIKIARNKPINVDKLWKCIIEWWIYIYN